MLPEPFFWLFNIPIDFYAIAYNLAMVFVFILAFVLAREYDKIPFSAIFDVFFACIIAQNVITPIIVWLASLANYTVPLNWSLAQIVAVLSALVISYIALHKKYPVPFAKLLDMAAPPIILFISVMRLGCLADGCCYGLPAPDLPWAITFTDPNAVTIYKNIPVHPTQLYECFSALAIVVLLVSLRHRKMWYGNLMWLGLGLYAIARFIIEFYRGDPRAMVGVFTLNQVICIALLTICGGILAWRLQRFGINRMVNQVG